MKATEEAFRALSELIISRSVLAMISEPGREWHLFCAETLRKAQVGEIAHLDAVEMIESSTVANRAF